MFNGRSTRENKLNKYVNQVKEKAILSRMPSDNYKKENDRFLYCDPPEVILQSKFF